MFRFNAGRRPGHSCKLGAILDTAWGRSTHGGVHIACPKRLAWQDMRDVPIEPGEQAGRRYITWIGSRSVRLAQTLTLESWSVR